MWRVLLAALLTFSLFQASSFAAEPPAYSFGAPLPKLDIGPPPSMGFPPIVSPGRNAPPSRTAPAADGMVGRKPGDTLFPQASITVANNDAPVIQSFVKDIPDGTQLSVSIMRGNGVPAGGQTATVKRGQFTAGPFSNGTEPLGTGPYYVDVIMVLPDLQPDNVQKWIGENGIYLDGPTVELFLGSRLFHVRKPFSIDHH